MADDFWSKGLGSDVEGNPTQVYPTQATASPWGRLEPLLTPEQLKERFLFGIPLVSRIKDSTTGKPMVMTDDIVKDYIHYAVNQAEELLDLTIMPTKYQEKLAFDRVEYEAWGYLRLQHKPVYSLDILTVRPSNNLDVFSIPLDWVETSNMFYGQLNIIPLTLSIANPSTSIGSYGGQGIVNSQGGGGAVFLNIFAQSRWVPEYFQIQYNAGFPNGNLPITINQIVGTIAAINILSMLGATWARNNSQSLGVDGLSQSTSGPGPNIYTVRIGELQADLKMLVGKYRSKYQSKFVTSNI